MQALYQDFIRLPVAKLDAEIMHKMAHQSITNRLCPLLLQNARIERWPWGEGAYVCQRAPLLWPWKRFPQEGRKDPTLLVVLPQDELTWHCFHRNLVTRPSHTRRQSTPDLPVNQCCGQEKQ